MTIIINTAELKETLKMTPASHNIMLVGKHGIGKSEILTDYYQKEGCKVVTLFLGQMSDPGDIIGLPARWKPRTRRATSLHRQTSLHPTGSLWTANRSSSSWMN